jgi:hypothetical protein
MLGGVDFGELDGEGVAFDGSRFYVAGSHGCSRKTAEFRVSSFLVARFEASGAAEPGDVELTYRLSDALRAAVPVGGSFAHDLSVGIAARRALRA